MNFGNSQKSGYFWEQTIGVAAMKSEIIPKNRGGCHEFWELREGPAKWRSPSHPVPPNKLPRFDSHAEIRSVWVCKGF